MDSPTYHFHDMVLIWSGVTYQQAYCCMPSRWSSCRRSSVWVSSWARTQSSFQSWSWPAWSPFSPNWMRVRGIRNSKKSGTSWYATGRTGEFSNRCRVRVASGMPPLPPPGSWVLDGIARIISEKLAIDGIICCPISWQPIRIFSYIPLFGALPFLHPHTIHAILIIPLSCDLIRLCFSLNSGLY